MSGKWDSSYPCLLIPHQQPASQLVEQIGICVDEMTSRGFDTPRVACERGHPQHIKNRVTSTTPKENWRR